MEESLAQTSEQNSKAHIFLIVDCSLSIGLDSMESINNLLKDLKFHLIKFSGSHPYLKLVINILTFSDGAHWKIEDETIDNIFLPKLTLEGRSSDMGSAFDKLNEKLKMIEQKMGKNIDIINNPSFIPPVVILISDGLPSDDYQYSLSNFVNSPMGRLSTKVSFAVGEYAKHTVFEVFTDTSHEKRDIVTGNKNKGKVIDIIIRKLSIYNLPSINDTMTSDFLRINFVTKKIIDRRGIQGAVFHISDGERDYALKWYYPNKSKNQETIIKKLIQKTPNNKNFLWPIDLVKEESISNFGYIMPLLDSRFKSLKEISKHKEWPNYKTLVRTCINIVESFESLHSVGLFYRDISFSNIYMDLNTGEIRIGDTDNIVIREYDDLIENNVKIKGTPPFIAPEIWKGSKHNTDSDLYSLAVLLFSLLYMRYETYEFDNLQKGNRMSQTVDSKTSDEFDPASNNYEPVEILQYVNILIESNRLPISITKLFKTSFTEGAHYTERRISESIWKESLLALSDSLFHCQSCGMENFFKISDKFQYAPDSFRCWFSQCSHVSKYFWLSINSYHNAFAESKIIVLEAGKKLYHNNLISSWDSEKIPNSNSSPIAQFNILPDNRLQIINLSNKKLEIIYESKIRTTLEIGQLELLQKNSLIVLEGNNALVQS